jgi:transposase
LKREIVAATLLPGASVSVVARQYDVNANQVFGWRRRHRDERVTPSSSPTTPGLVPVTITREPEDEGAAVPMPAASETIEIDVAGNYRVRVGSSFDPRALRRVLDVLKRR